MDEVRIIFEQGEHEPHYKEKEVQEDLCAIEQSLKAVASDLRPISLVQKSTTGGTWLTGEFAGLMAFSATTLTVLGQVAKTWITAKYGRKIRVKYDGKEIEAGSIAEIEKLTKLLKDSPTSSD